MTEDEKLKVIAEFQRILKEIRGLDATSKSFTKAARNIEVFVLKEQLKAAQEMINIANQSAALWASIAEQNRLELENLRAHRMMRVDKERPYTIGKIHESIVGTGVQISKKTVQRIAEDFRAETGVSKEDHAWQIFNNEKELMEFQKYLFRHPRYLRAEKRSNIEKK